MKCERMQREKELLAEGIRKQREKCRRIRNDKDKIEAGSAEKDDEIRMLADEIKRIKEELDFNQKMVQSLWRRLVNEDAAEQRQGSALPSNISANGGRES